MPKIQEIRRQDGTLRYSIYLSKEILDAAHLTKGDILEIQPLEKQLNLKKIERTAE